MDNRIKSLADVKLPGKEELRTIVIKNYLEQDVWDLPFVSCMVSDACDLLERGHLIKMDAVFDSHDFDDRCTDIMWLVELEKEYSICYVLLRCITEPAEGDMVYGYSHMVFERYNFESFPKYI